MYVLALLNNKTLSIGLHENLYGRVRKFHELVQTLMKSLFERALTCHCHVPAPSIHQPSVDFIYAMNCSDKLDIVRLIRISIMTEVYSRV